MRPPSPTRSPLRRLRRRDLPGLRQRLRPGLQRGHAHAGPAAAAMTGPRDVPALVPARMLTEYAYCPRLFFLMWVDRLMADNADVAEGRRRHLRVDKPTGKVPPPGGDLKIARSVELGSEELGIIAKLDLLETTPGGTVTPVEFKKGRPAPAGGAWEPDTVQLCAQILLLRDHGYDCDYGYLYYAATHQRIQVEPTEELIDKTLAIVHAARTTAERLKPPPPLVASPNAPAARWWASASPTRSTPSASVAHPLLGGYWPPSPTASPCTSPSKAPWSASAAAALSSPARVSG